MQKGIARRIEIRKIPGVIPHPEAKEIAQDPEKLVGTVGYPHAWNSLYQISNRKSSQGYAAGYQTVTFPGHFVKGLGVTCAAGPLIVHAKKFLQNRFRQATDALARLCQDRH